MQNTQKPENRPLDVAPDFIPLSDPEALEAVNFLYSTGTTLSQIHTTWLRIIAIMNGQPITNWEEIGLEGLEESPRAIEAVGSLQEAGFSFNQVFATWVQIEQQSLGVH